MRNISDMTINDGEILRNSNLQRPSSFTSIFEKIFVLLFILLFPAALSFPFLLYKIVKRKYVYLYFMGIWFALWSTCIPPIGDQSRYFLLIEDGVQFYWESWHHIVGFNLIRLLCSVFHSMEWYLEWLRIAVFFLSWCSICSVVVDLCNAVENTEKSKGIFYIFLILLGTFPWFAVCYGFRWGMACCFTAAGCYWISQGKKRILWIIEFMVAIFTHIAIVGILVPLLLWKIFPYRRKNDFVPIILLSVIVLVPIIKNILISVFPDFVFVRSYLSDDAYWNKDYLKDLSSVTLCINFIKQLPIYIYSFIIVFCQRLRTELSILVLPLLIVFWVLCFFPLLQERVCFFLYIVLFFDIMLLYFNNNISIYRLKSYGWLFFLFYMVFHYQIRTLRDFHVEWKFMIKPAFYAVERHYDYSYYTEKITEDGNNFK